MVCWSGFSPVGCISIQVATTLLVMSDSLPLQSSHSMLGYCCGFKDLDMVILSL
jgi:hypothetical protein